MVFSSLGELLDSTSHGLLIVACYALLVASVLVGRFVPRHEILAIIIVLCGVSSFLLMRLPLRDQVHGLVVLGFASYWACGVALGLRGLPDEVPLSFLPYLLLGLTHAILLLVSYTRSFNHGAAFAAPALALVLSNGPAAFGGKLDLFLLSIAAAVAAALAFPYFVSKTTNLVQALIATAEAAAASSAIFAIVITMSLVTKHPGIGSTLGVFFNVFWFALISSAFMASVGLGAHELVTWSAGVRLERFEGKASYVLTGDEDAVEEDGARKILPIGALGGEDPFDGLMHDMKEFLKSKETLSRIQVTEKKARFKREFQVLASRHKSPKRKIAKNVLDRVLQ